MIRMHRFENWRRNKAWIQSRSSEADYLIGERSILGLSRLIRQWDPLERCKRRGKQGNV